MRKNLFNIMLKKLEYTLHFQPLVYVLALRVQCIQQRKGYICVELILSKLKMTEVVYI